VVSKVSAAWHWVQTPFFSKRSLRLCGSWQSLHVTPAAVSQQVKSLEDYLQTPLFRRRGRTVELTSEGADLLPRVRRGLDELEVARRNIRVHLVLLVTVGHAKLLAGFRLHCGHAAGFEA